jgi:hypothetical protein
LRDDLRYKAVVAVAMATASNPSISRVVRVIASHFTRLSSAESNEA